MSKESDQATTAIMQDIDARFRIASGLSDRRDYSIFYSRLRPSRVMVIGIKPGGGRDGTHQLASKTFYENDEHEYVDMDYRIASVMRPALMYALGAERADQLRAVPKTNCFFHRAIGTDDFSSAELGANAALCAPFLAEMIAIVKPDALILEGAGARDLIVRHQCRNVREDASQRVVGLRRGAMNTFFRRETAWLYALGRDVDLLTLGHPSHFGNLPTWRTAIEALRSNLGSAFLAAPSNLIHACPVAQPASETSAEPKATQSVPRQTRASTSPTEQRTKDGRTFIAAIRPPDSFSYRPIHDYWQELLKTGEIGVDAFFDHLQSIGWRRPRGGALTPQIVRTDLVSMVKHGFAIAHGTR